MKDGHLNFCKACKNKDNKNWVLKNPQKRKDAANKYARANRDPVKAKAWWDANPHKPVEYHYKKEARKPGYSNSISSRRRAMKKQATPCWANEFFIQEAYHLAQLRNQMTGFQWDVDHIIPLVSKFVCGLHTEANLQVIPASMNKSKNNRWWLDMFEQPKKCRSKQWQLH